MSWTFYPYQPLCISLLYCRPSFVVLSPCYGPLANGLQVTTAYNQRASAIFPPKKGQCIMYRAVAQPVAQWGRHFGSPALRVTLTPRAIAGPRLLGKPWRRKYRKPWCPWQKWRTEAIPVYSCIRWNKQVWKPPYEEEGQLDDAVNLSFQGIPYITYMATCGRVRGTMMRMIHPSFLTTNIYPLQG